MVEGVTHMMFRKKIQIHSHLTPAKPSKTWICQGETCDDLMSPCSFHLLPFRRLSKNPQKKNTNQSSPPKKTTKKPSKQHLPNSSEPPESSSSSDAPVMCQVEETTQNAKDHTSEAVIRTNAEANGGCFGGFAPFVWISFLQKTNKYLL